jgi:prepilin-type N-terminal cleavage/methylation domain-containing protein
MNGQRGFSVIELLVASAILCAVSGAVLGLLHDGLAGTPVLEETTDLHQRARVVADAIATELRGAAAGTPTGALSQYFAAVEPRRPSDGIGVATAEVVTVRYVPAGGAHTRLAQPLAPGAVMAILDDTGCPVGTIACGFAANTTAVLFDTTGNASFVAIETTGPGVLTISDVSTGRTVTYPAAAEIAEALQVTFSFDSGTRQLRRSEGGGTFVVADNVIGVTFEYFGDDFVPLSLAQFSDGPFLGSGAAAFDADLLRLVAIRATVRLETSVDAMRGTDTALFARPGSATRGRTIPDIVQRIDVTLRNRN